MVEDSLSDRSQPARQPDGAFRRQGHRPACRQNRGAGHGGRDAGRLARQFKRDLDYMAVKEAVFPFARFPGFRPGVDTRNEVDR